MAIASSLTASWCSAGAVFLQFVAASPLLAYTGLPGPLNRTRDATAWAADATTIADITSASQALNVFDLESAAMKSLPIAHAAYPWIDNLKPGGKLLFALKPQAR